MGRRLVALTVLFASQGWARAGQAEEAARLVYVRGAGADECPDEEKLRDWVAARLGYDPFKAQASNVVIARLETRDAQLRGTVEMIDAQGKSAGRRELSSAGAGCEAVARAMALSISLAIDPERANEPRPQPGTPESAAAPVEATPSEPQAPPESVPLESPPSEPPPPLLKPSRSDGAPSSGEPTALNRRVLLHAAFATNVGALPGEAFGGEIAAGLRLRRWSLALGVRALQSTDRDVEPRGQISGTLFGAVLNACHHFDPVSACLVGQLALQRVGSSGVTDANTSSGPYGAVGPRLSGEAAVTRHLALQLGLEGLVNLARNHAVLSGRQVWEAPWLAAALLVGMKAHFP
ncbi:MAG TPA: hypothetical protein VJN18_24415 [Polyangiaceae bacterium]|nr:hypothetical protein [Polyangiaceae bacterium]